MNHILTAVFCLFLLCCFESCEKDEDFNFSADGRLEFSDDTISFDTVYSTLGSSTRRFVVYNNSDKGVRLTSVRLASSGNSGFRINVDGNYNTQFTDVEICHDDSIFVFVEITAKQQNSDSPILISDSLLFELPNGKKQFVLLEAYGQNVTILRGKHISANTTLNSKIPYVIFDSLVVDESKTLTISEGTTMCFHGNAELIIHGDIKAFGSVKKPITFKSDRTDKIFPYLPYDNVVGMWKGIRIAKESKMCLFDHCDIHAGSYGIKTEIPENMKSPTQLGIYNTVVNNVSGHGLDLNSNITLVVNSQISNTLGNCVNVIGGQHEFYHTTLAQFYPWKSNVVVGHALAFTNNDGENNFDLDDLQFYNCLITGYSDDEIYGSSSENKDINFCYNFRNSLLLTDSTGLDLEQFKGCIFENDTTYSKKKNFKKLFYDDYSSDFRLDSLSKARNIGVSLDSILPVTLRELLLTDKNGKNRPKNSPDAGCYQSEY